MSLTGPSDYEGRALNDALRILQVLEGTTKGKTSAA